MYSAVKVNGQKLYDLARKGKEVERPARDIFVREMTLTDFDEASQQGTLRLCRQQGNLCAHAGRCDYGCVARDARHDAQSGAHARGRVSAG